MFSRGNGLQKKDFILKGKSVIHYGQIYTKYMLNMQGMSWIVLSHRLLVDKEPGKRKRNRY